jgi:hypothetical protein
MNQKADERRTVERRWVFLCVLAVLILLPLLFYGAMVLGGKEPVAPDTVAVRPLGQWARQTTEELGTTPLWIPTLFSGMPSYGSYIHTPASPLSPFGWLFKPFADQRGVRYFLLMLLGGFSGYAFFRRQGVSAPAAAVAALGYVMTPYIPGVIEAGHSTKLAALMHVPLLLLALDVLLSKPGPLSAAFFAIAFAMIGWTNHPQIVFYAVLVGALYGLGRILTEWSRWGASRLLTTLGWLVIAGAVCFCLVAEPALAVREYAPYSIRGASESGGATWQYATNWSFHPQELTSFLFPGYFGYKSPLYFGPMPFTQSTHYVGIAVLLVIALGVARRRDARGWVWLGITLILLLIGFGRYVPILYRPFYELIPFFNKFRVPSMVYALLPLALGYLLARGLDALVTVAPSGRKEKGRSQKGWFLAAGAAVAVAALVAVVAAVTKSQGMQGPEWVRPQELQQYSLQQLGQLRSERWGLRIGSIVQGLLTVGVLLAAVPIARRLGRVLGIALLAVIVLADVCLVGARFVDFQDPEHVEQVLRADRQVDFLRGQEGPFRVLPIDEFGSNRFVAFGIGTVGGYHPAKLRVYQDLLDARFLTTPPILRMLNVRYLLSSKDPGHPSFEKMSDGVYAFGDALPRAWFVPSWRSVPAGEATLRALGSPGFDPAAVALFNPTGEPDLPTTGLPVREVETVSVEPHHVRLTVGEGSQPGLLVISEIFYPAGWSATIDGVESEILQANHCLRGLVVPPGEHAIEMRFSPEGVRLGRSLNRAGGIASLLLLIVGLWWDRRTRRQVNAAAR